MKIIKTLLITAIVASMAITGCKPKDADIKTAVDTSIKSVANLAPASVEVKEGVVTLSGQLVDESAKIAAETAAKAVKGVKSVVNNIEIASTIAPIVIAGDAVLTQAVKDAIKDVPTVVANVNAGVVTLTGEIKKNALPKLMMALSVLKPKKIENKLSVK